MRFLQRLLCQCCVATTQWPIVQIALPPGVVMCPRHLYRGWVMECQGLQYVLQVMWMAYPYQADSLQGLHGGNCEVLAANDSGIGSGWQQSRQN